MRRRLLNLATLLSLSLIAASVFMWTRSHYVSESWGLTPLPIKGPRVFDHEAAWERWRRVGSADGRIVWVSIDGMAFIGRVTGHRGSGYRTGPFMPPEWTAIEVVRGVTPTGRAHGEIPGVVEWARLSGFGWSQYARIVTVSWFVPAMIGAVLPAVRLWLYWRRQRRGPRFEVLPVVPK